MYKQWLRPNGKYRTHADAVREYVAGWENGKGPEGFYLGAQRFTYVGISSSDKGTPLVVLEAGCVVCKARFRVSRTLEMMRRKPEMTRTCPEHRGQAPRAPLGAWVRGADLEARVLAAEAEAFASRRKLGSVEEVVLDVIEELSVVGDVADRVIVASAARYLSGTKNNRRGMARTALASLRRKGLVSPAGAV